MSCCSGNRRLNGFRSTTLDFTRSGGLSRRCSEATTPDDVLIVGRRRHRPGLRTGPARSGPQRARDRGRRTSARGASHGNCGTITPSHAPPLAAPGMVADGAALDADARMRRCTSARASIRALWRWLLRFAARCNARDWRTQRARQGARCSTIRARGWRDWVRDYALDCEFVESGEDYVFRDPRALRARTAPSSPLLRELGVARRSDRRRRLRSAGAGAEARRRRRDPFRRRRRAAPGPLRRRTGARGARARRRDRRSTARCRRVERDGDGMRVRTVARRAAARATSCCALGAWSPRLADAHRRAGAAPRDAAGQGLLDHLRSRRRWCRRARWCCANARSA